MRMILILLLVVASLGCGSDPQPLNDANAPANAAVKPERARVPTYTYEVVNTFPHDPNAFTQGLFFHDGYLYESTGQYGSSTLRKVELKTGRVVQQHRLPEEFFGEGAALFNGQIYQLTWREGTAFVYDLESFKPVREARFTGEGWGLTNDDKHLIMSDGTHVIRFIDPATFRTVRTIVVNREDGRPQMNLNELELIRGEIWANIWHSEDPRYLGRPNHIARIDPASGALLGYVDLDGISPDDVRRDTENTLNGIAYDAENDRIFVTGKNWRRLFEIRIRLKE